MKKFSMGGQIYIALFASIVSHFLDALCNLAKIGRIFIVGRSSVRMLGHHLNERLRINREIFRQREGANNRQALSFVLSADSEIVPIQPSQTKLAYL